MLVSMRAIMPWVVSFLSVVALAPAAGVFGLAEAGQGTPTFAVYAAPSSLSDANNAGEPSVGVNWNSGAVMVQSFASTYKVVFNDASVPASVAWTDVTPSGSVTNIDPYLFALSNKGRTWAGGLSGACSVFFFTDNDGASWSPPINTCGGAVDHESLGAGPWHSPGAPLLASYDHGVYYCSQNVVISCALSKDGGTTYGAPATVGGACGGLHGSVHVSANGNVYVPTHNCNGRAGGGKSTNNGGSFTSYTIAQSTQPDRGFDPDVATTPDNTLWQAWSQGNSYHAMIARSTNAGTSWDRVTDLSLTISPNPVHTTFHEVVAGDNGRVAVAFLGSTGGTGNPFDNGYTGVWHLYVSFSYDAGVTWSTYQATSDPVQRGCIWDGGGSNECRNLLDFMDGSVTKDGRVVVAFADGCVSAACTGASGDPAQSRDAWATIARQSTGRGLFAAYDGTGPSVPVAPVLSATAGNARVDLSWTTPSDGGSAIAGYRLYRDGAFYQALGVQNAYADTAVTNGQTYSYRVSAVNAVGEGARSNAASATPGAANTAPTACFTHAETGLLASVDGACSSDADGTIASWSWSWGDGSPASSGVTASHAYAAAGTYTVTLTVTDDDGATGSSSQGVTVTSPGDPDPGATTLSNGVAKSATNGAVGSWQHYKIQVPSGKAQLQVLLDGAACSLLSCNPDLDLYVKRGARPTTAANDCGPEEGDSDETCTFANPAADWWYVGVYVYSGSSQKTYTIKATY